MRGKITQFMILLTIVINAIAILSTIFLRLL
jgi:hypothetical protein